MRQHSCYLENSEESAMKAVAGKVMNQEGEETATQLES